MNQIYYEPHDWLKFGDVQRLLKTKNKHETKKKLKQHGLRDVPLYGRSFTIKYSELVKAGLIHESDS
jgi:hypothetical protein